MLGHRELNIDDYLDILRRRVWWIVIPALILPIIAYAGSLALPNAYTSQTLVLVEGQKVPETFVRSAVADDLASRLNTMQEQILSRSRLQPLIDKFGLFKDDVGKVAMEDLVDRLRRQIAIKTLANGDARNMPGFYITFTATSPRLAQQVCAEITSMFLSENLKLREQAAQGTTDFLKSQLDDAKRVLDDQDAKLAEFKVKYMGQLPDQAQANMSMLQSLAPRLDATTQALSRAQQEKTYAEAMLTQQLSAWQTMQSSMDSGTPQVNSASLETQLTNMQNLLVALESRYTPDHPDVIKVKGDIAALKKRIDDAQNAPAPKPDSGNAKSRPEPKEIQALRLQVRALDDAIKGRQAEQEAIKRQISEFQSRIQLSPRVEEELKGLTRDYQTALQFYNDLLAKQTQSQMSTDLERRQQSEQFRIMDAANLPERPSFPNRPMIAGGGLMGGLVFGFGLALLLEARDKSLRTERDVEFFLKLPTLASVPQVGRRERAPKAKLIGGNTNGKRNLLRPWKKDEAHTAAAQV